MPLLLALLMVAIIPAPAASAQDGIPLGQVVEAESLIAVGAEPETDHAEGASGGAYVFLAQPQMEAARPNSYLEVPIADMIGRYHFRVRALAISGGTDSLRYGTGPTWPTLGLSAQPQEWRWYEFDLYGYAPGLTTVLIGAREPARIDAIEVTRMESASSAPHQAEPVRAEPNSSRPLDVNPPTFRWLDQGEVTYRVQVARDEAFAHVVLDETVEGATFLRPLQPLPEGELCWRWRVEAGEDAPWAPVERFEVPAGLAQWPLPPWLESFARIPVGHPRLFTTPERFEEMRAWAATEEGQAALELWRGRLEREIDRELPLEQVGQRGENLTREQAVIQRVTFKGEAGNTAGAIENLALLYALTGEERWAAEARRRALLIAGLDPRGYASHAVSDFGNGNLVEGMAFAYDLLGDYLSPEERGTIRDAIHERLAITAPLFRKLEQRVHNAHAWQHTLQQFAEGALAIADEAPDARGWFEWAVRTTVALYPWFGGADGGSAEMASYFEGTNLRSSMDLRDLIFRATGIDLCANPWYRSNIMYTIYAHPPQHLRSQFGDHPGGPSSPGPHRGVYLATRYRAALLGDRFAAAYAAAYEGSWVGAGRLRDEFGWLQAPLPEPASLAQLPHARAFRDIGVVYLHTAMERPDDNVFFEFKSGPYGSWGHSHGDQNAFNLAAFNEPLLIDTGYYHSYGDDHHAGWTMQTRAHNAILVDGTGQPTRSLDAPGRLLAFEQGDGYMYGAGEARGAYHEVALDRFTRHVLALEPDLFVVYDQLEAPQPHSYQYLLHAEREFAINRAAQAVDAVGERGQCRVTLVAPARLSFAQDHVFDPPALHWRDDRGFEMPDQWHLTAETAAPAASQRFLAIIEVTRAGEPFATRVEPLRGEGWLGVRMVRADGREVVAGFSAELPGLDGTMPRATLTLGPVSAEAFALAAELRDGAPVRVVTISGTSARVR